MKTCLSLAAVACVAMAATFLASTASRAEIEYPWCSITSAGQSGVPTCRYSTLEQCNAFISGGVTGFCQPNPRANANAKVIRRGAR